MSLKNQAAKNIGKNIADSFTNDPWDASGQAAGIIGTAVVTAGIGTGTDAVPAAEAAGSTDDDLISKNRKTRT
jgi:hypothetical protein